MANECWKPIKGFEGFYEVSSEGRVRGVDRIDLCGRRRKGKIISINSVQQVMLSRNGKKNCLVQKLVADAFLEKPQAGEKLVHVDYHPEEIIKQTEIKELELEIEELRTEVTKLKECLGELKRTVISW